MRVLMNLLFYCSRQISEYVAFTVIINYVSSKEQLKKVKIACVCIHICKINNYNAT